MTTDNSIRTDESIAEILQRAGVAGAGGAGFPSYMKWSDTESVTSLLVNHQESEPNYYSDKWNMRARSDAFETLFEYLLEEIFDVIIIGTKDKYRDEWMDPLEQFDTVDMTVRSPSELPVDSDKESGVVVAYTPDVYTYSEESVLLMTTAGVAIGDDLPTDHGWIVHNTETLYNVYRALSDGTPVTRKYVVVDGNTPRHRCLDVPVGTPASTLLEAAGLSELPEDQVLADGGPGWCYRIDRPSDLFGVRKRTNGVLVLDETVVEDNLGEDGEIDVLEEQDWTAKDHETTPTRLEPDTVRIPLITNEGYIGLVEPSVPTVSAGDTVSEGERIADPHPDSISIAQHASIDGEVVYDTETHVVIRRQ